MARYTVNHAYQAFRDGQSFGRWEAGIEVELAEADAEWVNRDSPGTLTAVAAKAKADPEAEAEPEAERQQKPARGRQQRGGRNRSTT